MTEMRDTPLSRNGWEIQKKISRDQPTKKKRHRVPHRSPLVEAAQRIARSPCVAHVVVSSFEDMAATLPPLEAEVLEKMAQPFSITDLAVDPAFLFRKVHPIRSIARAITSSSSFESFILTAIFVNLVCMAMEDVSADRSGTASTTNDVIAKIDFATLMIFTAEFVAKVLAMGILPLPSWVPSFLQPEPIWRPQPPAMIRARRLSVVSNGRRVSLSSGVGGDATQTTPLSPATQLQQALQGQQQQQPAPPPKLHHGGSGRSLISTAAVGEAEQPTEQLSTVVNRYLNTKNADLLITALKTEKSDYYFRQGWNRLDFVMLLIGYVNLIVPSANAGLSGLRALRTLRPLRAFRFFAPLQSILNSLWQSAPALANVMVCLSFFFILFSLMGQQFFQGALQRRCVVPTGADALRFDMSSPAFADAWSALSASTDAVPTEYVVYQPETWCSFESDPRSFQCSYLNAPQVVDVRGVNVTVPLVCADVNVNPDFGLVNFDDLGGSLYCVFMISSLQVRSADTGWCVVCPRSATCLLLTLCVWLFPRWVDTPGLDRSDVPTDGRRLRCVFGVV